MYSREIIDTFHPKNKKQKRLFHEPNVTEQDLVKLVGWLWQHLQNMVTGASEYQMKLGELCFQL